MGEVIRKVKDGRFIGWYLRYVDVDGRRKQRASHQPSYALARRLLIEIEARVARGAAGLIEPAAPGLTVAELCERFLSELSSPRIKDLERYRADARTALGRILPHLGSLPLSRLTRPELERARDAVGRRYRPNTVRATLRPLGTALSWAVRKGILTSHPGRGLELPQRETAVEYLDKDEVARLLTEAERCARQAPSPLWWSRYVAVALALHTGLRRGEIFGLRWCDVDVAAGRLTVARSYRGTPKSGRPRHLRIPAALAPLLSEWRSLCPPTDGGWICPVSYRGRWGISGERTAHGLPILLRRSGCRPLRRGWHALRHTFASHFIMQGGNILTLQKILGHSDIGMTLVYSHLAPDFMAQEMDRLRYK